MLNLVLDKRGRYSLTTEPEFISSKIVDKELLDRYIEFKDKEDLLNLTVDIYKYPHKELTITHRMYSMSLQRLFKEIERINKT